MRRLNQISADLRFGTVLLPWLAAALGILAVKFWRLHCGGFHETAVFLGRPEKLGISDSFALFRGDLLVLFFLVPALILLITIPISRKRAINASALIAGLLTLLTVFEMGVWDVTGSFTSLRLTYSLVSWELASHDRSFLTILPHVWIGAAALLLFVVMFTVLARLLVRRGALRFEHAMLVGLIGTCFLGVLAWIPRLPVGAWTPSLLGESVYSFFLKSIVETWKADRMEAYTAPQLIAMYRAEPHIPSPRPSPYFGKAQNANLLIFTMESMSAHVLDPAQDTLADMPNLRRLREHAFVMGRHYTSYPQTNYALFSMLTSLYARCSVGCSGNELVQDGGPQVPSLMNVLGTSGYQTGFYGYVWSIPSQRDDVLLKSLGFERLGAPSIDAQADRDGQTTFFGPVTYTEEHDLQSLAKLRQQLRQWTGARQRFAAMFFPEVGHDPYRALDGLDNASILERGRALAVLQDAWLGQIMDELQQDGVLDNTIIVVTGDHGMRFNGVQRNGAPMLTADGKLDDAVMRVPMLIYVPQALKHTVNIDYPTSHIDLMPTILDLMGRSDGQAYVQGSPMMDPRLRDRRLFLPMGTYGASGFYDGGSYFMLNYMGGVYKSTTMSFSDSDALLYAGRQAEAARKIVGDRDTAQSAMLDHLLHPGS